MTALMSLLNRPPLSVLRQTALPVELADGRVSATGTLSLPLAQQVTSDEIAFHLTGVLENVESDVLVPGHTVQADRLQVTVDQTTVSLSGRGEISGLSADVTWRHLIGAGGPRPS